MATQVHTTFVDDLDGTEAEGTVEFAFEGKPYEIDLSKENFAKLAEILQPYITAGRRAGRSGGGSATQPARSTMRRRREELEPIRQWARENGYQVSDRGRVAKTVIDAYNAAHGKPSTSVQFSGAA
jgi:hypothetical protein